MASRTKNHSHLAIVLCWGKKNLPFASSSRFEFDWLFGRRQARQARQARRRRWVRQEQLSVTTQSDSYLVCRAHQRWQLPSVSTSSWRRQLPIEKRLFACIWQRRARCGGGRRRGCTDGRRRGRKKMTRIRWQKLEYYVSKEKSEIPSQVWRLRNGITNLLWGKKTTFSSYYDFFFS